MIVCFSHRITYSYLLATCQAFFDNLSISEKLYQLLSLPRASQPVLIQLLNLLTKWFDKIRVGDGVHQEAMMAQTGIPTLAALLATPCDTLLYHVLTCLATHARRGIFYSSVLSFLLSLYLSACLCYC
jgi:hypothetical protein